MSGPEEQPSVVPPTIPAADRAAITFRWDLDKTYLRTQFESLRHMVRIPFEAGSDKVHLPGVPQLIKGLRRCAMARAERPYVFFLSASPPQIGNAIREKLEANRDGAFLSRELIRLKTDLCPGASIASCSRPSRRTLATNSRTAFS